MSFFRRSNSSNDAMTVGQHHERKFQELKASLGPLSGRNEQYCTDACLKRYLEARSWNVEKSRKMLEESLKWRSTFKPEDIRWHEIASESAAGKIYRANFRDRHGRTVLILRPGLEMTASSMDSQTKHMVYVIENAILNLPEGQDQMTWLIDFTGWSMGGKSLTKGERDTINILQNHYPERLAMAFLYNPPRIFEAFWMIVKYFLDPKIIDKLKFVYPKKNESVQLMRSYFDVDNLPTEFGGNAKLQYDHEEYSKQMMMDDDKSAKMWNGGGNGSMRGAEEAQEPEFLTPPATPNPIRMHT